MAEIWREVTWQVNISKLRKAQANYEDTVLQTFELRAACSVYYRQKYNVLINN